MHLEVLPPGGEAVLSSLTQSGFLRGFYLAGGTGLALQCYSIYHLLRSLVYFDDADREPEPMLIEPLAWDEVKEFFRHAQREMMRGYEQG